MKKCKLLLLTLLVAILTFTILGCQTENSKNSSNPSSTVEKKISVGIPEYMHVDLDACTDLADYIFYGKVVAKEERTYFHDPDEKKHPYQNLTMEVITPIKGDFKGNSIVYKQAGGEDDEYIYEIYGITPYNIGDECIIFLNKNSMISDSSRMKVEDGKVTVGAGMLPTGKDYDDYTTFKTDEYIAILQDFVK